MLLTKRKLIAGLMMLALLVCYVPVNAEAGGNSVTIPVSHSVKGTQSTETVNIVIERITEDAPLPHMTTMPLTGNDSGQFDIVFDSVGRYDYKIREIEGGTKSTAYDAREYKVIVSAVYDTNNDISTSVVFEDGTSVKPEAVAFEDESQAQGRCAAKVRKKIQNNKGYKDKFQFKLEGEGVSYTTKIKGEGTASFPEIKYTKPGTYKYKITEVQDHPRLWKYDSTEYTYKVTVTEKDGKVTATANKDEFTFTNTPKIARKAKELSKRVSRGAQTGDDNYLGLVAIAAIFALIIFIVASKRRRNDD